MKYSLERLIEIWNNDDGTRIEIGPDRDGLGLIEIRERNEKSVIEGRLTFNKEQAHLIAQALLELSKDV